MVHWSYYSSVSVCCDYRKVQQWDLEHPSIQRVIALKALMAAMEHSSYYSYAFASHEKGKVAVAVVLVLVAVAIVQQQVLGNERKTTPMVYVA